MGLATAAPWEYRGDATAPTLRCHGAPEALLRRRVGGTCATLSGLRPGFGRRLPSPSFWELPRGPCGHRAPRLRRRTPCVYEARRRWGPVAAESACVPRRHAQRRQDCQPVVGDLGDVRRVSHPENLSCPASMVLMQHVSHETGGLMKHLQFSFSNLRSKWLLSTCLIGAWTVMPVEVVNTKSPGSAALPMARTPSRNRRHCRRRPTGGTCPSPAHAGRRTCGLDRRT
jgi:hypothetical protein